MTAAFAEFQGKQDAAAAVLAALEEELARPRLELTPPLPPLGDGPDEVRGGEVLLYCCTGVQACHLRTKWGVGDCATYIFFRQIPQSLKLY